MPRLENGEIHPDQAVIFADRHDVTLTPGGAFATILGCEIIRVNSLHGQGILDPGKRVVIEGVAEDGTIESDPDRRCAGLCPRRPMACGVRPAAQSDQPRAVRGVREALKAHRIALRVVLRMPLDAEAKPRHRAIRIASMVPSSATPSITTRLPGSRMPCAVQRIHPNDLAAEDGRKGAAGGPGVTSCRSAENDSLIGMDFRRSRAWACDGSCGREFREISGWQRAAEGDVHFLQAAADAEDRNNRAPRHASDSASATSSRSSS